MANVLYVKTNPKKPGDSFTFKVSDAFLTTYKESNPGDDVTTLDLDAEGVAPHDQESLGLAMSSGGVSKELADQFAAADKVLFAAPFWNFGIPARLKAYIDHIVLAGVTFNYTDDGPVGILEGKKAFFITARGGNYSEEPLKSWDFATPYLKAILGFMGISDYAFVAAEGTAYPGNEKRLAEAIAAAESAAKNW